MYLHAVTPTHMCIHTYANMHMDNTHTHKKNKIEKENKIEKHPRWMKVWEGGWYCALKLMARKKTESMWILHVTCRQYVNEIEVSRSDL